MKKPNNREPKVRMPLVIAALALVAMVAWPAPAGATLAGNGGGSDKCTSTTYKEIDRKNGFFYEEINYYCDNPATGSSDCTALGSGWNAVSWTVGTRPDYNHDAIVCNYRIVIRMP